jgi:DNA-binding GntR family transcriptional regulator
VRQIAPPKKDADPPAARPAADGRKSSLHQDAVAELRKIIVSGELLPGERLREVALSERLGMSRTPLREAFRTLAAEGLVELLPNRSVVVSELDPTEAADVFALLGSLEALAALQACHRMTLDQIQEIGRLHAEMVAAYERGDRPAYTEANRTIHELIVLGSNNASLIQAWRLILPRADRARRLNTLDPERWAQFLDAHQSIYEALTARDGVKLAGLMRQHFAHAEESTTTRITGGRRDQR